MKENAWIEELRRKCDGAGLLLYPLIRFTHSGQRGDIDALILDLRDRFGIVCQLKWLTIPGRISQGHSNDQEIKRGIQQAQIGLEWIASAPRELTQLTGLSNDELREFEFKPLVLCKRTLASGRLGVSNVPVINERIFDRILGEPHNRSLRAGTMDRSSRTEVPAESGKAF